MSAMDITRLRLQNQQIAHEKLNKPGELVAWMGAMQAQDYTSVRWAVGLRCHANTDAEVQKAVAESKILRTWLVRGTLHLVSPEDIHWMLGLVAPGLIARSARRDRQLELDGETFARSSQILANALQGGQMVTRAEVMEMLDRAGISTTGQRGYHILARLALEGLICFGPPQGKQQTFVLLDEWVPKSGALGHEEAMEELASRYFTSHGPTTLADFTWWSGLSAAEARQALELAKDQLEQETINDQVYWLGTDHPSVIVLSSGAHLLPAFDEYYLGYTDRSAYLDPRFDRELVSSNGVFRPMLVIDGRVMGTWKHERTKCTAKIHLLPFQQLSRAEHNAIAMAVERYGNFLGLPIKLN